MIRPNDLKYIRNFIELQERPELEEKIDYCEEEDEINYYEEDEEDDYYEEDEEDEINYYELEKKIDKGIKRFHGFFKWEQAVIDGDYPVEVRNKIANNYKENGWNFVYHRSSSENGERSDLTVFKFSHEELEYEHVKNFHKV